MAILLRSIASFLEPALPQPERTNKDFHLFLFFHLFFSGVNTETAWEA